MRVAGSVLQFPLNPLFVHVFNVVEKEGEECVTRAFEELIRVSAKLCDKEGVRSFPEEITEADDEDQQEGYVYVVSNDAGKTGPESAGLQPSVFWCPEQSCFLKSTMIPKVLSIRHV